MMGLPSYRRIPYMKLRNSLIPKIPGTMGIFAMSFTARIAEQKSAIKRGGVDPPYTKQRKDINLTLGMIMFGVRGAWRRRNGLVFQRKRSQMT